MPDRVEPFVSSVAESAPDDLRGRLRRAAGPDAKRRATGRRACRWATPQDLCGYWADSYDWRADGQ